eukprot:SAG31_NODE_4758_length_2974_cov_8.984696_2_plen_91_part_00
MITGTDQAKELKDENVALRRDVARLEKALKNVDNRAERSEEKNKQLLKEKSDLEQKLASTSKDKKENAKRLQLVQDQVNVQPCVIEGAKS